MRGTLAQKSFDGRDFFEPIEAADGNCARRRIRVGSSHASASSMSASITHARVAIPSCASWRPGFAVERARARAIFFSRRKYTRPTSRA